MFPFQFELFAIGFGLKQIIENQFGLLWYCMAVMFIVCHLKQRQNSNPYKYIIIETYRFNN